jgi:hypothetical protein
MSFLEKIKLSTEDCFIKYSNFKTELNFKLFTNVIKTPSKEDLGLDRQSVLIKREAQANINNQS